MFTKRRFQGSSSGKGVSSWPVWGEAVSRSTPGCPFSEALLALAAGGGEEGVVSPLAAAVPNRELKSMKASTQAAAARPASRS